MLQTFYVQMLLELTISITAAACQAEELYDEDAFLFSVYKDRSLNIGGLSS
jgi:hypothetical protein